MELNSMTRHLYQQDEQQPLPTSSFPLEQSQQSSTTRTTIGNPTNDDCDDTFSLQLPSNDLNSSISTPERKSDSTTPLVSSRSDGRYRRHRNVTSLIRVIPAPPNNNQQSCVFPMLPPTTTTTTTNANAGLPSTQSSPFFDPNMSIDDVLQSPEQTYPGRAKSSSTAGSSGVLGSKALFNDEDSIGQHDTDHAADDNNAGLILVTPNAIGKHIRAHITVETARLVSQVANLGTEDWLRLYNTFTAVEWNATTPYADTKGDHDATTATDSIYLKQVATEMATAIKISFTEPQNVKHHGVVLSIGMADPNVMLTFFREAHKSLRLDDNQVYQHGAVVKNLTQSPLDSDNVEFLLRQGLRSHSPVGAIVATLTVWPSAVDMELNRLSKCQYLQFVHLPSSDVASTTTKIDRSTISLRQSLSALGTILRHLVSQHDSPCSFRDGTLTKVLQRSLEPTSTRVLVMGTVSSDIVFFERTAHTLNYIQQLFGISTAASPFQPSSSSMESLDCIPSDLAKHPAFLQSYVSDPRQRIAELERKVNQLVSPQPKASTPTQEAILSDDDDDSPYRPTNYMDLDPLIFQSDYFKDPEEKKAESVHSPVKSNAPRELKNAPLSPNGEDDKFDDVDDWYRADPLYALTQEFTSSMQLSSPRAAESLRSLEYSYGEKSLKLQRQQHQISSPSAVESMQSLDYSHEELLLTLQPQEQRLSSPRPAESLRTLGYSHEELSLIMQKQRQQLERLEDSLYRPDNSIFGDRGESSCDEELLAEGESLVDDLIGVNTDYEVKDKAFIVSKNSSKRNDDSRVPPQPAESTSNTHNIRPILNDNADRAWRPTPYRMDSKLSGMTTDSDDLEETLDGETSFAVDDQSVNDASDVDKSDVEIPRNNLNDVVHEDIVLEFNRSLESSRLDAPGIILEGRTFEVARLDPNEDLLVDTSAWDTPESNSKSRTASMRRNITAQPSPRSHRPPPFRMDSKLSLMTSNSDEAGRPLVTTPGVPSSISLQIALEKARVPESHTAPSSFDRLRRHQPSNAEELSLQHFDSNKWEGEQKDTTVFGDDASGEDGFVSDLKVLQGAIDEMRTRNIHSWREKASALERLEQHFARQHAENQRNAKEVYDLEDQLLIADSAFTEELEKLTLEAKREKNHAQKLAKELESATSNSSSYEKVAEQAVSSIESLHQETIRLKADLTRKEAESEKRLLDFNTLLGEQQRLAEKLKEVQNQASDLSFEQNEAETVIKELESKVKSLTEDRDRLKLERDKDRLQMDVLQLESEDIADVKTRLRSKQDEIDSLVQTNDSLSARVFEQQKMLSQEVEKREAESETLALKVQTLTLELASAKKRAEDAAGDQQSFRNAVHEEQIALREKLRHVEAERDHLHQLRHTDLSEMETLKLESAIRADLEKRLKAAGSEIDRLRAARSKVYDEIAVVRAEAATRVEEKDNAAQQLKLELHQARIEATSLRRRLVDATAENDRIRKISEEDHHRMTAKLGAANDELSHLRAEVEESMHAMNLSKKELKDLKITIRAREEETSSLKAELDRVKSEQAESTDANKKLMDSLHDLRNTTRAQVMAITEKKRENEIILEKEREKSSLLDAEISRLLDELAKVRKEQELDRDGLGILKEDLAKLLKEKSDALNKAALLERQLKEIEVKAEDLEHELELTKLKSNEDLLRKAKEEYRSVQSAHAQLTEAINGLTSERDALVHDTNLLRRNLESVQKAKAAIETKAAGLETLLEQRKHMIDDLEHQLKIADMRSNGEPMKKARQEIRALQKTVAELQVALEDMKGQRDSYHDAVEARNAELGKREGIQRELESRIMKLENNKTEMKGQVSTMLSKLRITEHNANEIQKKLATTMQTMAEMELARSELQQEFDATIQKRGELERLCDDLRQELETAIAKRDELERACSRLEEAEALRNESYGRARQQEDAEEERHGRIESVMRAMEQEIGSLRHQLATRPSDGVTLGDLRAERERYEEASQLIVTLAHRAKTSTEQRDRMIRKLKGSLVQLSEQKEAEIQTLRARLHEWERSIVRDEEYHWR
ncbi:hypothetical protein MHU86_24959 [Fragilaria crotonensis]|nr:hypothetical protein MHU86_24959 [Fragilaria crotonensis]